MHSSSLRGSQGPTKVADLFCTACDSQIGTYENEWIRLTSSYIIPKVNGTKFGIIVADEHRTVDGKEATALHGCDLSEASCSKCSKAIGHFCRNAPGKPHLVGQYIYKLSKTHLKLTRTTAPIAFNLVFGSNQPQQARARSMFTAPPKPAESPYPYPHGGRNEVARKSMGPPSSRPNIGLMIDPALAQPVSTPRNNRDSSTQSAEPTCEEKSNVRETCLILRRLEEQDEKLSKMSESMNDWKIQNGKLLAALMRSSPVALARQDTSSVLEALMDDFEFMVNAAYEARSGNDELEILRAENESMKTKLQTIALAMGSATGDFTLSQPLTSLMTASSTPSVLGKRKRMDARSRHSLLQHEVSFTDDDDLNDQSGIYAVGNATNMTSTPARQLERLSTPSLPTAQATQYVHISIPATNSTAKPTGAPTLAKTTAQTLNPPDSDFAEQHDRESRSQESDRSLDVEPERSGNPTPEVNGSIHECQVNAASGLGQNTDGSEVVDHQVVGTMTVQDGANDRRETSASISWLQSERKPTQKIAAATNTYEREYVAMISEQRQKAQATAMEDEVVEMHGTETRAGAASPTRRKTTNILAQEADTEQEGHEVNIETEQRRETTNTLHEKDYAPSQNRGEPGRLIRPQGLTRAAASQADCMQETGGIVNGYATVREQIPEEIAEPELWQDSSMTNLTNDEEREELFELHRDDQHETQMNGNNKENEQPYYTHSADAPQSKQSNRGNRDPNKPKRVRRKPDEIERKYKCLFPGCTKAYGGLPHLNTHISDSSHGERWSKVGYLEASKKQGNNFDYVTDLDDSMDLDRLAEERNAAEAVAALKRNQDMVDRVEKLRQRDRKAKEAMEREEMMELMNMV